MNTMRIEPNGAAMAGGLPVNDALPRARQWRPLFDFACRHYRWAVYALLALVIGCGVALSLVMERTATAIGQTTAPLLQQRIPQLRYLGNIESAVLRYQLAMNKYYSQSISQERYQLIESVGRQEMKENLLFLQNALGDSAEVDGIAAGYRHILLLTPQFDKAMADNPQQVRHVLAQVNEDVKGLRARIDDLQQRTENVVYEGGNQTGREVAGIRRLVHWFSLLALLTAGFMIYHVRARFQIENELAHQAGHDPLTGLAHRRSFEKRLQAMQARPHTVVLGTIDRFARVVGGFGHAFGDQMMQVVAGRIRAAAELHGGEVFRLDGANFAVLYQTGQGEAGFQAAVAALRDDVRTPFSCGGHEVFSSLSLGCASFPADGRSPDALLRNADAALQASRRGGGDSVSAYSRQLNAQADQRLDMETQLRYAINRGELELFYQPQQSLANGKLVGFEALLRWRRDGALVSPAEFIPLAEECGLIVAIGDWVLEQACRRISEWRAGGDPDLVVAVNISPRQFAQPDFLAKIQALLETTHIDPSCIELEITEGVVMEDAEAAISLLHNLKALGLKLSIDDFGTGYSSLAYLKRFPIDKLKIDQSFVRQLGTAGQEGQDSRDGAIVQATISLGHNLGMTVIAEGVETPFQRELLRRWHCDEIQGYHYGRPMPAPAALLFIEQQTLLKSA